MAKMKPKSGETSVPLISALIFFILMTIVFGVMWYLSYSEMAAKEKAVQDAQAALKKPRDDARIAEQKARVYRAWLGIEVEGVTDDKSTISAEAAAGDEYARELAKLNAAATKKLQSADADTFIKEFNAWTVDSANKVKAPPAEGFIDQIAKLKAMTAVYKAAETERDQYAKQIDSMKATIDELKTATETFNKQVKELPKDFQDKLAAVNKTFEDRTKKFETEEKVSHDKIGELLNQVQLKDGQIKLLGDKLAERDTEVKDLRGQLTKSRGKGEFEFEEPQGKILRKLPEGAVEISIGSAVGVKPGLTFTVLPPDFPEKGKQSRMRMLRVPDGKGGFVSQESFVPKGALEVYEVVGPNLSLARVQPGTELDPIRDGVAVGDLIYNSAWRKGVADHIALIGIFDINGDGNDDIESVVRDFTKIGIPVDAYFDMKKRAWVGEVNERTRHIVMGRLPIVTGTDPNRDEKSRLLDVIKKSVEEGQKSGAEPIDYRKFFSYMGYKFRLDLTDDKINQATAPYLSKVGVAEPPQP